jgi:hypothetical protein
MAIVPATPGLFAVLAQNNFDQIGSAIGREFPGNNYPLVARQWLLAAPGKTTKEISDTLGVTGGESTIGSAVVVAFNNYFGRANPQIWEWLSSRLGG